MHEPMAWIIPAAIVLIYLVWAVGQARRAPVADEPADG